MDYFERLILRALALPRHGAAAVFDPFDQVAPSLPTPSTAPRVSIAGRAIPPAPPAAAALADTRARDVAAIDVDAAAQALPPPVPAPLSPGPEPAPAASRAGAEPVLPPAAAPAAGEREAAPLARADAFMRQLGAVPPSAISAAVAHRAVVEPAPVASPELPATEPDPRPSTAPICAPPIPPQPEMPHRAAPRERRASQQDPPAAPASASEAAAAAAERASPHRIVQSTTVVVGRTAHTLDDLAHSSAISRFGLGQW